MKDELANLPASILARLRDVARERRAEPQLILRRYAIERLLFRLSRSPWWDKFLRPLSQHLLHPAKQQSDGIEAGWWPSTELPVCH
jgi:hypothetical protein